ncbi:MULTISPECIES: hypothetical protein [unclassified Microcoleus]|uniref:hypothetical protein n=1 Tax=unclassified Microcoleus TaxID=2642155 RepID=UPI002FCE9374
MASSVIWQWIAWDSRSSFIAVLANVSDDQGLIEMLAANINYFKDRPDDLPQLRTYALTNQPKYEASAKITEFL